MTASLAEAREVLRRTFGHTDFRGLQGEVITEALAGRSALVAHPELDVIRERFKLYGKVRGITAMGRMTANMLAFCPLVMVGALYSVNPSYVEPLWTTQEGHTMVLWCVGLVALGYVICRKMSEIKV